MTTAIERDIVAQEGEAADEATKKFLTFYSDGLHFAVDIGYVIEIITSYNITPLPRVPDFVIGIINLRGQVIPIMDMRLRAGKPAIEYTEKSCIIVLEIYSMMIGILVDEVAHVIDVKLSDISPSPSNNGQELVSGIARIGERVNLVLDCERLVE